MLHLQILISLTGRSVEHNSNQILTMAELEKHGLSTFIIKRKAGLSKGRSYRQKYLNSQASTMQSTREATNPGKFTAPVSGRGGLLTKRSSSVDSENQSTKHSSNVREPRKRPDVNYYRSEDLVGSTCMHLPLFRRLICLTIVQTPHRWAPGARKENHLLWDTCVRPSWNKSVLSYASTESASL